jgi:hypothetical protein
LKRAGTEFLTVSNIPGLTFATGLSTIKKKGQKRENYRKITEKRKDFFNCYSGGRVESNWVHSALRPAIGLLCQPQVIVMMEKLVE